MRKNGSSLQRRNRGELPATALVFAASILVAVLLISLILVNFREARDVGNATGQSVTDIANDIRESDIMQYDGLTVQGADVINFYRKYLGDYVSGETGPFTVTIGGSTYSNGSSLSSLQDVDSSSYVKPTAKYKGKVTKNANGVITNVAFTKK